MALIPFLLTFTVIYDVPSHKISSVLDENLKPWLLEVNRSPSMSTDNPVLERLVPEMIENLIKIVVDQKLHGLNVESKFERIRVNRSGTLNEKDIICSDEKNDTDLTLNTSASSSETEQFKSALGSDIESNPSGSESSSETTEKDTSSRSSSSKDLESREERTEKLEDKPTTVSIELEPELDQLIDLRIRSSVESIPAELSNQAQDDGRPDDAEVHDTGDENFELGPESVRPTDNDSESARQMENDSANMQRENLQESSIAEDISSKIPITDSSVIQMFIS